MVERYPYKVDVTSSSLVATTMYIVFSRRLTKLVLLVKVGIGAVVVQLVRIPACHAGGREFESRPPRQLYLSSSADGSRNLLLLFYVELII